MYGSKNKEDIFTCEVCDCELHLCVPMLAADAHISK